MTLLTGNTEFSWGVPQQLAYEALKKAVAEEAVLWISHDTGMFRVEEDASGYAMGVVLSQMINGKWRPIVFMSKSFNEAERNYEIYDKEMLAIMKALEEWQQFLIGVEEEFEVWTDHLNLVFPTTAEAQSVTSAMVVTDGRLQFQAIPQTRRVAC
jgi:hypothetical protein